uniref:site-specific DNA-methyltransferase (cytosine-N(4)-specific) n=1 Tax=viral metagenome TaxID=1070528 RepID=A0A6M3KX37_9ZZZZ
MTLFTRRLKASRGKNIESLAISRRVRAEFIQRFGSVPYSVIRRNPTVKAIDWSAQDRSYGKVSHTALSEVDGIEGQEMQRAFETAYRGVRPSKARKEMAISRFPQNVGQLLVKFYCPRGGIVYDPFAGHNSRMQLCYELGRCYHGFDVSITFMKANIKIRQLLYKAGKGRLIPNEAWIRLELQSSDDTGLPDDYADFTVTSPPYWDIEYYGDESEQLGKAETYETFLDKIKEHLKENWRVLKPGAFSCWCINDFRKGGEYYMYHSDIAHLGIWAGFKLHTIYIIDIGVPAQGAFVQTIQGRMAFPKGHEYCIVFKKGAENE